MSMHNISESVGNVYLKKWAIFWKMIPQLSDTSVFPKGFGEVLKSYADTSAKAYKLEEAAAEAKNDEHSMFEVARAAASFYEDIVFELRGQDSTILKDYKDFMGWLEKGEPARARTFWKSFKKEHPKFEEHRRYKTDFGPKLDKWSAAHDRTSALAEAERKQTEAAQKFFRGLTNYIVIYSKAMERATLDERVRDKFAEFLTEFNSDRAELN